jgi:uncharacterized protein YdeI (YjbR/CyaY-like superfamily)
VRPRHPRFIRAQLPGSVAPTTRRGWRAWLSANHGRAREVWLIYRKHRTGTESLTYEDSIEEALCFGWVDSLIKRIDDDTYARKFSRRRKGSAWSELNKRRVRKLIEEHRMTPAGIAAFEGPAKVVDRISPRDAPLDAPDDLAQALEKRPSAMRNFVRFPPSSKRLYISWILNAKKRETRARRVAEAVQRIANNEKTLLK